MGRRNKINDVHKEGRSLDFRLVKHPFHLLNNTFLLREGFQACMLVLYTIIYGSWIFENDELYIQVNSINHKGDRMIMLQIDDFPNYILM